MPLMTVGYLDEGLQGSFLPGETLAGLAVCWVLGFSGASGNVEIL